jgi:hypothetical protein
MKMARLSTFSRQPPDNAIDQSKANNPREPDDIAQNHIEEEEEPNQSRFVLFVLDETMDRFGARSRK